VEVRFWRTEDGIPKSDLHNHAYASGNREWLLAWIDRSALVADNFKRNWQASSAHCRIVVATCD
jgi:hypothetical protein